MRITREEIATLPDGTDFYLFLSGNDWGKDLGKSIRVIKIGNTLFKYLPIAYIDEIDTDDEFDIQAAINMAEEEII